MRTSEAIKHLVCARRVAARNGNAGAPVASQKTAQVLPGLARDMAAAPKQLNVADAMRGQVPTL